MTDIPAYLQGRGRGRGRGNGVNHSNNGGLHPGRGRGNLQGAQQGNTNSLQNAEEQFQAATSRYQESIKRHLGDGDFQDESSSDEEDIGDSVLEKVFKTYSASTDTDVEDLDKAQESLLHSFRSGTSACLICIETIKKTDPIWSCYGCYGIFHIQCIQKWVREGVYQQIYKSDDDNIRPEDIPWHCPKCRTEFSQKLCPSRYYCFCGKVEDPHFDPWLVPHSCGQSCGRPLKPECGHLCLLLCHPGACPPCPQTVKVPCYCGNSPHQTRRCSARTWSCGGQCGRLLSCGQHRCQQACHPGECPPCPKKSTQPCQCGKKTSVRLCANAKWNCELMCGKQLTCGNHVCERVCHSGPCGPCPRGGARKCPCGKTDYDLPCTEDIPTCGDTCDKLLECGIHSCTQRCHQGQCGTCRQMIMKRCRCKTGQKEKEVPCYKDFLCEVKCTNIKDCGKHQCKRKCCDGNCPSCEQICGKTLRCKKHKCMSKCHRGPCYPCMETVVITCFCKFTKITVPCGREKVTKPPRCNQRCKVPPACHHPMQVPHRCHFRDCPPCPQPCNKSLPNCSHVCPFTCHSAVKVKKVDNTRRAGPWEGGPKVTEEIVNKQCPPCRVPIPVECLGKHEIANIPCAEVRPLSCGKKCGRELACTNHVCSLECHTVEGAESPELAGKNCQTCELPCQHPRPEGCTHKCPKPCHPGACPPCKLMFKMRCHCQATIQHIPCHEWNSQSKEKQNQLKSCKGACPKQLVCGHRCGAPCHPGACLDSNLCEKKTTVHCKCRRQKKEFKCKDVKSGEAKLECNDVCMQEQQKKKKKQEEAERKKKEEEEQKQKAELEEFERKMKGRKRKQRKQHEDVVEETFLQKYKNYLILAVSIAVLAGFTAYILNISEK